MIRWLALAYGCVFGSVLVLKLAGVITASWGYVLAPLYVPVLLTIGALIGMYVVLTRQGTRF